MLKISNFDIITMWFEEILINALKGSFDKPDNDKFPMFELDWRVNEKSGLLALKLENGFCEKSETETARLGSKFVNEVAKYFLAPKDEIKVGSKDDIFSIKISWED